MERYYLSNHVQVCLVGGGVVFLDLNKDIYLTIPPQFTAFLEPFILSRILDLSLPGDSFSDSDNIELIRELKNRGLISTSPQNAILPQLEELPEAVYDIDGESAVECTGIELRKLFVFIKSFILSILAVRVLGLRRSILIALNKKKKLNLGRGNLMSDILAFRDMRALLYKSRDKCYFDCTVLFHYLVDLGHEPRWVFGVAAPEFKAHCWIQVSDTVVSEYVVTTSKYTPIMVI